MINSYVDSLEFYHLYSNLRRYLSKCGANRNNANLLLCADDLDFLITFSCLLSSKFKPKTRSILHMLNLHIPINLIHTMNANLQEVLPDLISMYKHEPKASDSTWHDRQIKSKRKRRNLYRNWMFRNLLPAEEPTSKILSTSNSWESHRQTAITSLTSAKPVRVALPVDFPAPLVSKVTEQNPLQAKSEAMPLSKAWQPPMSEKGCTNTITRFLSSSSSASASLGLKILVWSFTPSSESTLHDSTVKFDDDIFGKR